ncbi:MAG: hypothetical protein RIR11_3777 [Bacteroidota bacterium]|jgi:cyanophycinase-like exopeptidase
MRFYLNFIYRCSKINILNMRIIKTISIIGLVLWANTFFAQGYTKWVLGDTSDMVTTNHLPGIVLAGGGTDNDNAMVWMLNRAAGGDVVIIRASGSNGYNSYFFSELGVSVNSVETIRFDAASAANDPYVIRKIRNAEVLFIAGGDQYDYYQYWRNTPIEDAINYLLNEKKGTVGGTSAGMAILGDAYYAPPSSSLTSVQALANPYHPNINVLGKGDFLKAPFLQDLVTDTHYDQRERQGRQVTFLARLANDYNKRSYGIACNEFTAVCIDGDGIAKVFGSLAYFLRSNCQNESKPETILSATPLTWNRQQAAIQVYKMPGAASPTHTFNLNDWETASGGTWENWYVQQGVLQKQLNVTGICAPVSASGDLALPTEAISIVPNPANHVFQLKTDLIGTFDLQLLDSTGRLIWSANSVAPNTNCQLPKDVPTGVFNLQIHSESGLLVRKLIIQ